MAPLALSELTSLINRVEDKALRMGFLKWASRHIESVHIKIQAPIENGVMPVLEAWDEKVIKESILRTLYEKIGVIETKSEDESHLQQRLGVVIIKD